MEITLPVCVDVLARDEQRPRGGIAICFSEQKKCRIEFIGECWYHLNSITNVLFEKDLADSYVIDYVHSFDYNKRKKIVHLPDQELHFREMSSGLWYIGSRKPKDYVVFEDKVNKKAGNTMINTLA